MVNILLLALIILVILFIIFKSKLVGEKLRLLDNPNKANKIHNNYIPKVGGILIFLSIIVLYLIQPFIFEYEIINLFKINYILFFSLFFLIGLLDDIFDLKVSLRFLLYGVSIFILLYLENELILNKVYFEFKNYQINFGIFAIFFSIFCIIFLQNCLNMIDGINGLLITIFSSFLILLFFITKFQILLILIIFMFLILYLNLKNKLFLGNNGSSLVAAIVSVFLIETHNNYFIELSAEKIFLIFFLPSIEVLRLFILRISKGRSPFSGDLNHFHHIVLLKINSFLWIPFLFATIIFSYFFSLIINTYLVIFLNLIVYISLIYKYSND